MIKYIRKYNAVGVKAIRNIVIMEIKYILSHTDTWPIFLLNSSQN